MVWWDPKHQEPKAAFLSFHPSVSLFRLFCLHSPVSMSQSSKCDEHHRLHNAKSPSLIDDTVNTSTHTHAGMPALTVSHTRIHAHVRSPAEKTKTPAVLAHTSTGRRAPLLSHGSPPGSGSPVLHAHTLRLHTLISRSPSLSATLSLSHTHTH